MKCIAVIPARSGSKGLRDKNIKELNGKPLLAYTIEAAAESEAFDTIHVSTDSEEYAKIAKEYGADVPFLRAPEYATDSAATWDVVKYTVEQYEKLGRSFDVVGLLQPTTPLRTAMDIRNAFQLLIDKHANAVVSVCETDHSPLWTDVLPEDGNMKGFVKKEYRQLPRQEMPTYYRVNGAIYLVRIECLGDMTILYDDNCYSYVMSRQHSIDIDTQIDFIIASELQKMNDSNW
ncbi:MAG: acylneuraminate cytidylyltransferase family protein [Lachnospiraceae bacterium]|nr:acylneuraminate cytidylyltransferase family protein [Lachnospiraceae bacterium]